MFLQYVLRFLAITVFLYLAWRKMKSDFGDDINSFLWSVVGAFLIGGRLIWAIFNLVSWDTTIWDWFFFWSKPGFSLTAGIVSGLVFVFIYCLFDRYNFYETCEDLMVPFIIGGIIFMISNGWVWLSTNFWWPGGLILIYLTMFWAKRYRSFYWYRSGKKGFLFLWSGTLFGFYLFIVSFLTGEGLGLKLVGLFLSLLFLIGLVMLGEIFEISRKEK